MKKTLLLLLMFVLVAGAFAQTLLDEDFSAGTMPPSGWLIMGNQSSYVISQTANAGGVLPEARLKNSPAFNGSIYMISPQINTTGLSSAIISFKHMFDYADAGATPVNLSVQTRSSASAPWNNVWTKAATADILSEMVNIVVNNSDMGSATFQFCFKLTGSTTYFKDWFYDDIKVFVPTANDAAMSSISVPVLFVGNHAVTGKFVNLGTTPLNSVKVNWMREPGVVHTNTYSGLNLGLAGEYAFTCTDSLQGNPGIFDLKVWVSNLNGSTSPDDNPANDTLIKSISIPDHLVYRRPMYEEFTSSTCSPCASFNNSTFNPFIAAHGDEITLVKYQMNWPGSGDPYYTAEGGVRRSFYGVNAVPDLYVDGKVCGTNSSAVNNAFAVSKATMTYLEIQSVHEIQGNKVNIDCNILPYANYSGYTAQIAIVEKVTTQNVATNGETEFHNVMMKMVPDASGTVVNLTGNQPHNLHFSQDMTGTNVEQMNDLAVAIFIQNGSTKEIINSNYSIETGAMITLAPTMGTINVPIADPITATFSQAVRLKDGTSLNNSNVSSVITFKENDATGTDVPFTATINSGKTVITIQPDAPLHSLQQYYLKVDTLENLQGIHTLPAYTQFTTALDPYAVGDPKSSVVTVFPNPATNRINVRCDNMSSVNRIEILNSLGKIVRTVSDPQNYSTEVPIRVSDLSAGLYFVRVLTNNHTVTSKVLITR